MSRRPMRLLAGIAVLTLTASGRGAAQITTDAASSVLFFPLVVADGERDTMIQLVNDSPQRIFARCAYAPAGAGGADTAIEFDLVLVAHQSTHWVASRGRVVDPSDPQCDRQTGITDCDGAGFDPGTVPALPAAFRGDLICVQLDRSHAAMSGNALRGVATLVGVADGDVAKYAAVGLAGLPVNDADNLLCLGGTASSGCARGAEYAACPVSWLLNHRAEGAAPGSPAGATSPRTRLVVESCSQRSGAGSAMLQLSVVNEFEQRVASSLPVQRSTEIALGDLTIFDQAVVGSEFLQTRLSTAPDTGPGIVVIALTDWVAHDGTPVGGAVAAVPYREGVRAAQDRIVFPDE